jgi:hypothetical protein
VKREIVALVFLSLAPVAPGEPLLPTALGTTWEYRLTQEPEAAPVLTTDRIDGPEKVGGKDFFKLVRRSGGALLQTDFIAVDGKGIFVSARLENGRTIAMNPPQPIVALPLRVGAKWPSGTSGEVCEIATEEDLEVAAGKFRAYRIHCARHSPLSSATDRWFAPGVGVIKEVSTTRAPTGDLLQRTSLELQKPPTVIALPGRTASGTQKRLSIDVASTPEGEAATNFSSAVASVCARWSGHGLRPSAKVRAVWIAEDVAGVAPPDYKVDEASTIASASTAHGILTLSRPEEGWAEGEYRVEFYLDETFVDAVKVKIGK